MSEKDSGYIDNFISIPDEELHFSIVPELPGKTERLSLIRQAFSDIFSGYYNSFSFTDSPFEHDTVIKYAAFAEYSGAIVGPTHKLFYAALSPALMIPGNVQLNSLSQMRLPYP